MYRNFLIIHYRLHDTHNTVLSDSRYKHSVRTGSDTEEHAVQVLLKASIDPAPGGQTGHVLFSGTVEAFAEQVS